MNQFLLGADPELFLQDAAKNFVSSVGLIGGSKEVPKPMEIGEGFFVQEDNVAVEYNIPPSGSKAAFNAAITAAMSHLSAVISQKGLLFSNESAVVFPDDQLQTQQAQTFGCDPDFNAWRNGKPNPAPRATNKNLRTCGGHVHVGYRLETKADVLNFIKHMDLFLGVPSVLLDNGELRKELYGKAGAFRFKRYGCEYRSLSNFWTLSPRLTDWVWDATDRAIDAFNQGNLDMSAMKEPILTAINKNDKALAMNLVKEMGLPMPANA